MKLLVFLAGFVVMAAELLAGRVMAPLYGSGIEVWGAVIGFFLLSMSLGYWTGGVVADSRIKYALLFVLCGLGVSVFLLHPIRLLELPMILSAFLLTFLPGFLGGAVMPLALKHDAHSLKKIGHTAGTLSAWSTVGSVVGTFATIYLLLPSLGVVKTIVFLSVVAFVTAALVNRWFFLGLLLVPFLFYSQEPLTDLPVTIESPYGLVKVFDLNGFRQLSVNGGAMSEMNISNPDQVLPYWEYLVCQGYWLEDADSAFLVGVGAGTYAHRAYNKGLEVTAVEINPVVLRAAQEYFGLEEKHRMTLIEGDGRIVLKESADRYDLIVMDAMQYNNYSYQLPPTLITADFFALAKDRLEPDGKFTMHILATPEDRIVRDMKTTLESVFAYVDVLDCQGSQVLVASDSDILVQNETIADIEPGVIYTDDKIPIPVQ